MARKYDSSRREEAAQKTRETIIRAAVELHGLGVTDYESLAEKANVAVATVRKHFPTREQLFESCTSLAMHEAPLPDLEELGSIADPADRLCRAVSCTFAMYESMLGQIWTGLMNERDSAVLRRLNAEEHAFLDQITDVVLQAWAQLPAPAAEARGYLRGLLSYLTYRALRHDGSLSPEQTTERITEALLSYFEDLELREGRKEAASA